MNNVVSKRLLLSGIRLFLGLSVGDFTLGYVT